MDNNIKTAKDFIGNPMHKPNFQVQTTDGKTHWISRSVAVLATVTAFDGQDWYILINRRGEDCPDFHGMWNIPCGYLDWGESCEEACCREIWEECGVKLEPKDFKLFAVESDPVRSNKQNVTIRFIANLPADVLKMHLSDENSELNEIADIRWVKFTDADQYQWAFNHRELMDLIYKKIVSRQIAKELYNEIKNV